MSPTRQAERGGPHFRWGEALIAHRGHPPLPAPIIRETRSQLPLRPTRRRQRQTFGGQHYGVVYVCQSKANSYWRRNLQMSGCRKKSHKLYHIVNTTLQKPALGTIPPMVEGGGGGRADHWGASGGGGLTATGEGIHGSAEGPVFSHNIFFKRK